MHITVPCTFFVPLTIAEIIMDQSEMLGAQEMKSDQYGVIQHPIVLLIYYIL